MGTAGSKLTGTGDEPIYFGRALRSRPTATSRSSEPTKRRWGANDRRVDQGAVYVFTRSRTKWTEQEILLTGEKEHYVEFGWSVALSEEGNTAVVGGPENGNGTPHAGHVWFFKYNGSAWKQQGTTLTGATDEELGSAVALSGDRSEHRADRRRR